MSSIPLGWPGSLAPTYPDNAPLPDNLRGPADRPPGEELNYYGLPPLKSGNWKWYIPAYFWVGGTSAGTFLLATLADVFGNEKDRGVVRWGRYASLAGLAVSPVLLILDLGRPERFHHMLRIFKPRSPMSFGTWILSGGALFITGAAAAQLAEDLKIEPDRARKVGKAAGATGIPLVSLFGMYTGVLLSATSVPLWARARRWLAPLFFASAIARSAAVIDLLNNLLEKGGNIEAEKRLAQIEGLAMAVELGTMQAMMHELGPVIGRELEEGLHGKQRKLGAEVLGIALPALLLLPVVAGKHLPRPLRALASLASLVGGFFLYWSVTKAGQRSAEDPQAYFTWTSGDEQKPGAELLPPRRYPGESGAEVIEAAA